MRIENRIETERADLVSYLGVLASRLRVHALALQGMGERDAASIEERARGEMAGDLDAVAGRLDLIRQHLCSACRMLEVVETVSIVASVGRAGRAGRSPAGRRRSP